MNQSESVRLYDHPDALARRTMLNEMHRRCRNSSAAQSLHAEKTPVGERSLAERSKVAELELV